MDSPCSNAAYPELLSWVVSLIRDSKFEASDVFPDPGSNIRHPLSVLPSLHRVQRDQFPGFISTMRVLRHPTAISPHFVSFAWRYLGCTRCVRSLPDECTARGLELVTRYLQPGIAEEQKKSRTLPSSWGTSIIRLPCSKPTPAGLLASDHCDAAAWPLVCKKQRLPRKVFRSSIAWLSDSLFTLRGVSYLSTTQDSLPVAGQALLDGIHTRKVPVKGFKVVSYISFPFPKLRLAQLHHLQRLRENAKPHTSHEFWSVY